MAKARARQPEREHDANRLLGAQEKKILRRRHVLALMLALAAVFGRWWIGAADDATDAQFLQGWHSYQRGDLQAANDAFAHCLDLRPTRLDCRSNLATVLTELGESERAEELFRAVLAAEPGQLDAAFNLAMLLQDQRTEAMTREAVRLYRRVVAAEPARWDAWSNLAAAAASLADEPMEATRAYQRAIVELERTHKGQEPSEVEVGYLTRLYYGLGTQLSGLSPALCYHFATDVSSLFGGPLVVGVDAGAPLDEQGAGRACAATAQMAQRRALALDPTNVQAAHMLAALLAEERADGAVRKASPAFVKALFDDFSDSFDENLAALGYAVPKMLGEAAAAYVESRGGAPFASALDAGCGTGLAGPYLRPLVSGTLACVDLSPKMLEKARDLTNPVSGTAPLYDVVLAEDLLALTRGAILDPDEVAGVELVAAADVLVYFGELRELLDAMAAISAPSSVLICSCERVTSKAHAPNGWRLRASGRFEHTREYVVGAALAAGGWQLVSYAEITPRHEHGLPVQGHLFVFGRGDALP